SYEECHKSINGIDHKLCNTCLEWMPCNEEYFYKNKQNKIDGYNPYCKVCTKIKSSKWRKDNPELRAEQQRRYQNKPTSRQKEREFKKQLRERGIYRKWQHKNKDKLKIYNLSRTIHKKHEISESEWQSTLKYFDNSCAYCGLH